METMQSKTGIILIIFLIAGGVFWYSQNQNINNPTLDIKTNTKITATSVQVGTFYDGKDGYTLSIPSGNSSICTWNYTGGNAAIPYIETTQARSATEKHTIYSYDYYDWKVSCTDDFGNHYVGIFPKK